MDKYLGGRHLIRSPGYPDGTMASIQNLPEDLLFVIFHAIQRQEARSIQSLSLCRSLFRCLTCLSLVCKSWRESILQCSVLWTCIPVDNTRSDSLEGVLTMLQRSRGAELTLSTHLSTDPRAAERTDSLVNAILDHHSRVRSMHLTADPRPFMESNMPSGSGPTVNRAATANPSVLNPSRHLSSLFKGLRILSLSLPSSAIAIDISGLLHIIKTSPELEFVHLTSIAFIKEDRPLPCVVHASRLQRLRLHDCNSAVILSYIAVPKNATISITMSKRRIRGQLGASPLGEHILHALPYSLSNVRALEDAKQLVLEEDEEKGTFGLGLSPFRSRSSSMVIRSHPPSIRTFLYRSLSAIANHPYFGTVESFTFSHSSRVPVCWSTVLGRFDLLLELNTLSHHGVDIVHALTRATSNGFPRCSSLRRIRLFHRQPGTKYFDLDSHLLAAFHQFRTETRCPSLRITVHYSNGIKDEL